MELSKACNAQCSDGKVTRTVYRVIDGGTCILTTLDPLKALNALQGLIEKYDITSCWAEAEPLQ